LTIPKYEICEMEKLKNVFHGGKLMEGLPRMVRCLPVDELPKDHPRLKWDGRTIDYYPVARSTIKDVSSMMQCQWTDLLTRRCAPVFHRVSTATPAAWSNAIGRIFNDSEMVYLMVELPGRWKRRRIEVDLPRVREKMIADSQEYYGAFITTVGCMTPIGDLDAEQVVWGVTQQLALP
jgi:hypothetical protein